MPTKEVIEQCKANNEIIVNVLKTKLTTINEIAEVLNVKYGVARRLVSNLMGSSKYEFRIENSITGAGWYKRYQIVSELSKDQNENLKTQWFNDLPKKILREDLVDWFIHKANKGYAHKITSVNQLIKEAKKFKIEVYKQFPDGKAVFY